MCQAGWWCWGSEAGRLLCPRDSEVWKGGRHVPSRPGVSTVVLSTLRASLYAERVRGPLGPGTPLPPAGSEPCRCPSRSADASPFSGRRCEPAPDRPSSPQRPSLSSVPVCRGTSDLSPLLSPSRQAHLVPRLLCQGHHDPRVSGSLGPALLAAGDRQSVTLGPASRIPGCSP